MAGNGTKLSACVAEVCEPNSSRGNAVHTTDFRIDTECSGYDHCWIYDRAHDKTPGISVWSELSGIK